MVLVEFYLIKSIVTKADAPSASTLRDSEFTVGLSCTGMRKMPQRGFERFGIIFKFKLKLFGLVY